MLLGALLSCWVSLACADNSHAGIIEASQATSSDYYEVLGLERGCDEEQVKKHYRRLAMHWHPDKNKEPAAEDNFQRIAEAYEVLSNAETRRSYDRGDTANDGFTFTGAHDVFSDVFDGLDPFEQFEHFFGGESFEESVTETHCEDTVGDIAQHDETGELLTCVDLEVYCDEDSIAEACPKTCKTCGGNDGNVFSTSFTFRTDGLMEHTETVIEDGEKVTKTIRKEADGRTHATIEESEVSGMDEHR